MSARWVKMTDRGPWHQIGEPAGSRVTILCREAPVDYVARLSGAIPEGEPLCDQCITLAGESLLPE